MLVSLNNLFHHNHDNTGLPASILDIEAFNDILRRERARADRTNGCFSLLVFDVGGPGCRMLGLNSLAEAIVSRVRLSDRVGWVDNMSIGILLPDTRTTGAGTVLEQIRAVFPENIPCPSTRIYQYPSRWET